MTDVFISYSRKDTAFVRRLYEALEAKDYDAWVDWDDIEYAEDWWAKIQAGIEEANHFVFVISPDSVQSTVCADEVEHATKTFKRIVPLLYRPITAAEDHQRMHPSISRHNWLPFSDDDDFDSAITTLIDTLNTNPEHVRLHTRLLVRAIEWDDAGRPDSLLLRGEQLNQAEQWLTAGVDDDPTPSGLHVEYIAAAQAGRERRSRNVLIAVSTALVITLALAILSFVLFQQSEGRLALAQERGTAVAEESDQRATQQFLAEVAEATAVRSAAESRALALAANAQQALEGDETDLAVALALEAIAIDNPPPEAQNVLVAAAFTPGTRFVLGGHNSPVTALALSPDERLLLTGTSPRSINTDDSLTVDDPSQVTELILWDVTTGELLQRTELPQFYVEENFPELTDDELAEAFEELGQPLPLERIEDIRFSADGQTALVITNRTVIRWDVTEWELIDAFVSNMLAFTRHISADGQSVFYSNIQTDRELLSGLFQVDPRQGNEKAVFSAEGQIWSIATSAERIALGMGNGEIILVDRATNTEITRLDAHETNVQTVAFRPDGSQLVSVGIQEIKLWDAVTGELIREAMTPSLQGFAQVRFAADGRSIVGGLASGQAVIWNAETLDERLRLTGHADGVARALFTTDGQQLITGSHDQTVRVWDLSGGELQQLAITDNRFRSVVIADERGMAFGGTGDEPQNDIVAWDLEADIESYRLIGHTNTITNLAISPDERLLASSSFDDTLRLWDIETGEEIRVFEEAGTVLSADFSPDGRYLTWSVSMSMTDDEVVTWDLQEETEAARISVPGVPADLKYMADGASIIVALNVGIFDIDTYAVRLDPFTGDEIQQYTGAHDSFVLSVSISEDGQRVLTSGLDTTFYMWDVETGDLLQQFVGHGDEVRDVAFAAGDAIAVSVSVDSTVRFWDVTTSNEITQFTGHDRDVSNVAVSADGQTVLTGGRDGTMRLWQVPVWDDNLPDQLREARYAYVFSCTEREQYRIEPYCETDQSAAATSN